MRRGSFGVVKSRPPRRQAIAVEVPVVKAPGRETDRQWLNLLLQHTRETGRTALFFYDGYLFAVGR